ncbi:MAG: transposase [Phycisphaerae bacterium]|nr:transposase [Phycisphaerae bacterium]NUQ46240.1 transposase [Phycisphaerae bacterium]
MGKTYRPWNPGQSWLLPPSPRDWLPEGDLVYFVLDAVSELDLSAITEVYEREERGYPRFHPQMMVTLLLYSYTQGVFSSRRIMKRCERDAAYRVIVRDDVPDFRTISDFRKRHMKAFEELFVHVLRLCRQAGLVILTQPAAMSRHEKSVIRVLCGRTASTLLRIRLTDALMRTAADAERLRLTPAHVSKRQTIALRVVRAWLLGGATSRASPSL